MSEGVRDNDGFKEKVERGFERWGVREGYTHTHTQKGERHTCIHIEIVRDGNTKVGRVSE